jgi:superfamily I DNA/RNA helicase
VRDGLERVRDELARCDNVGVPLPAPQGKQREVVTLTPEGHVVVLGTAGSGKTTMAIHRAAFVGNPKMDHGGRTLLVTFNNTLVTYLEHLRPAELANVDVRTYHRFARGYLGSRGLLNGNSICKAYEREALIREAIRNVAKRHNGHALFKRSADLFLEEVRWMNQHGIEDEIDYIRRERVGRAQARLVREHRPAMYEVYREYRELREAKGRAYDWDDIALAARRALDDDDDDRFYRHVVIDEGQDFSPEMVRSLALAVPEEGSLTMFADVAQQIYGRRLTWSDAGLEIDEPWKFEKNYRNSPQIAALGLAIAEMPYFAGEPDMVEPTEFAAAGPKPVVVNFDSIADETAFVIEQAKRAAQSGSVAILLRRKADVAPFQRAFPAGQRLDRHLPIWNPDPGVSYGTVHGAKGLEFDTVIIPRLRDDRWPEPMLVDAVGKDEATADDGRLLYVAVTRTRQGLIMTHTGDRTELMPDNDDLWLERRG